MKLDDRAQSLAGEAYLVVKQRILRGELAVGQAISRRKLASELGMSFLPVSEALIRLEFEGLLESRPRAGTRVRIPTEQDVRGHYAVREALEVQAARLFAENATREEKSELLRLAIRVDGLSVAPDADRVVYLSLHERLHGRIAECAQCPALSDAIEKTHVLASTWNCVGHASGDGISARRHEHLIETLAAGSPAEAADAMREHIVGSMQRTLARLESFFELGRKQGTRYVRTSKTEVTAVA